MHMKRENDVVVCCSEVKNKQSQLRLEEGCDWKMKVSELKETHERDDDHRQRRTQHRQIVLRAAGPATPSPGKPTASPAASGGVVAKYAWHRSDGSAVLMRRMPTLDIGESYISSLSSDFKFARWSRVSSVKLGQLSSASTFKCCADVERARIPSLVINSQWDNVRVLNRGQLDASTMIDESVSWTTSSKSMRVKLRHERARADNPAVGERGKMRTVR